jgi:hypothetical protein
MWLVINKQTRRPLILIVMRMILINNTRVNTKGVDANRELNKTQIS